MVKWFLIIIVVFPLVALAGFTEEPQFGAWRTQSMNWADLDLDGDPDLAEQNSDGQDNYLYLNRNDGTFAEVALPMEGWSSTCTAWGDCDNVNGPDLAVGCNPYPRANFIFVNDGAGNFEKRPELGTTVPSGIAWADYDLDGDLDVAIVTRSGTVSEMGIYLYINDGDGYFTERFINYAGGCDIVAWGDCDNDGDPDLAVGRRSMFQNYLLINNGHGDFELTEQFGTGETTSFAWGDYDNDGDLDMAVTNSAPAAGAGSNYLYTNLGHCVFSGQKEFGTLEEYSSWSIAWADYDNDGDLDAAVGNAHEPQNTLYVNGGNGSFAGVQEFGEGSTYSVSWADYDLDGDLDLAAGNFGWGAQSYLYVNDENDGDYLSVHLEGRFAEMGLNYSNTAGVGAKVSVFEEGYLGKVNHLLGFREIEANGSHGQDSIEAEFGLPNDDAVEIRIIWPGSHDFHIIQDLIANKTQFITVYECVFHLLSPGDGEDVGGFPLTLSWEPAFSGGQDPYDANLENYTLEISTDENFTNVIYTVDVTENNAVLDESSGLVDGETYFWRVFANYVNTPGHYSQYSGEAWSFTFTTVGITLDYFDAASENDGIELSWDVNATEDTEIAGFNLYRSVGSEEVDIKGITSRGKLNAELITGASPYSYLDAAVDDGATYSYWLEVIDVGGSSETFGPVDCTWNGVLPTTYALYQSRPNPATGTATIAFDLPEDSKVTLTVYDISGRKVTTLVNETLAAGEYYAKVPALAPGVYVYKLDAGTFTAAKKMVVQ